MAIAGLDELLRNVSFFDLNSRVVDAKPLARDTVHSSEKLRAVEVVTFGHDVTAHCKYT